MEIGTEISQKIRSAIKAKLIELGVYVDDELPDYIMVMVANKKTQQQMTDDLHLFLNVHTETFTTWLHSLLLKLQSINTDQPILSDEPPGKEMEQPKSKERHKGEKKKRTHGEKPDKAHSGKLHPDKARVEKSHSDKSHPEKSHSEKTHISKSPSEKSRPTKSHSEKTRSSKSHPEKSHSEKSHSEKVHSEKSHSEKSHPEKPHSEKPHSEKHRKSTETTKRKRSTSKEQPKAEQEKAPSVPKEEVVKSDDDVADAEKPTTTETAAETVVVEAEEIKDEINITENTDEFAEEVKEVKEEKVKKRPRSKSPAPPPKVATTKPDKHSDAKKAKKSSSKVTSKKKEERKEPASKPKPEVEKRKRSLSSSSDPRKKPSSVVGTHKRKYEELDGEEEGYDPMNPAVGNVASGVRVPARKSSVPKSLQANRSLLMKAVTEAERSVAIVKPEPDKSVKKTRRKRSPEVTSHNLTGRIKTAAGLQLISKSRRREMLQKMTYTVDNEASSKSDGADSDGSDSRDDISSLKYTVKNESTKKTPSPQKKSISKAVAPSRVAVSALKEISKNAQKEQEKVGLEDSNDEEYGPPLPDSRRINLQQKEVSPESEVSERDSADVRVTVDIKEEPAEESPSGASDDVVADPEIQKILEEATEGNFDLTENISRFYYVEENKRVINKEKWTPSPTEDSEDDTRFIVTLDGVHPDTMESVPEKKQTVRQQAVKPMPKPTSPTEDSQPAKDAGVDYSKMQPPKIKPFNISLKDSDDEGEGEEMQTETTPEPEQTEEATKQTSILERCRFWPACANGNSCQYVHPTVPCKTFPYCKFSEKCIYIHPNCKYDAKCTRHDCPFTHASKRSANVSSGNVSTVIHKYVQVPIQPAVPAFPPGGGYPPVGGAYQPGGGYPPVGGAYQPGGGYPPVGGAYQSASGYPPGGGAYQPSSHGYKPSGGTQCRFYPNCSNMNCPFVHPKPCRFGMSCRNPSCSFYHPPMPTKEKLKWSKDTSSASILGSLSE